MMINGSSQRAHSVLVGRIMILLAGLLDGDKDEWELVGLLHDVDYDAVQGDMAQHGVVTAESLKGRVSDEGLHAIRSHDHRTGFNPRGLLADSLRYADAIAVLMEDQELKEPVEADELGRALRMESSKKPWIEEIIMSFSKTYGVQLFEVLKELGGF